MRGMMEESEESDDDDIQLAKRRRLELEAVRAPPVRSFSWLGLGQARPAPWAAHWGSRTRFALQLEVDPHLDLVRGNHPVVAVCPPAARTLS